MGGSLPLCLKAWEIHFQSQTAGCFFFSFWTGLYQLHHHENTWAVVGCSGWGLCVLHNMHRLSKVDAVLPYCSPCGEKGIKRTSHPMLLTQENPSSSLDQRRGSVYMWPHEGHITHSLLLESDQAAKLPMNDETLRKDYTRGSIEFFYKSRKHQRKFPLKDEGTKHGPCFLTFCKNWFIKGLVKTGRPPSPL